MAIDVYKSVNLGSTYEIEALYYFAQFISASASWEIVDSWAQTAYVAAPSENTIIGRYKGDPIADLQWTSLVDIGQGAGIVIQMKNPRPNYPTTQIVFQAARSASFGYISGHGYRHDEGFGFAPSCYSIVVRIGVDGDWDFDDVRPDFGDPSRASDTYAQPFNNLGTGGNTFRCYFIIDDELVIWLEERSNVKDFENVMWMGRYNAKSAAQDTAANPAFGILAAIDQGALSPDGGSGGFNVFLGEVPATGELFGCLDENGVWRDWDYMVNPGLEYFLTPVTQPNEFDSSVAIDLFEIVVKGRDTYYGYDNRLIGSLRGIYAAQRLGNGAWIDSGDYMCLGVGYGVVVDWDGSTTM